MGHESGRQHERPDDRPRRADRPRRGRGGVRRRSPRTMGGLPLSHRGPDVRGERLVDANAADDLPAAVAKPQLESASTGAARFGHDSPLASQQAELIRVDAASQPGLAAGRRGGTDGVDINRHGLCGNR